MLKRLKMKFNAKGIRTIKRNPKEITKPEPGELTGYEIAQLIDYQESVIVQLQNSNDQLSKLIEPTISPEESDAIAFEKAVQRKKIAERELNKMRRILAKHITVQAEIRFK